MKSTNLDEPVSAAVRHGTARNAPNKRTNRETGRFSKRRARQGSGEIGTRHGSMGRWKKTIRACESANFLEKNMRPGGVEIANLRSSDNSVCIFHQWSDPGAHVQVKTICFGQHDATCDPITSTSSSSAMLGQTSFVILSCCTTTLGQPMIEPWYM